MVTYFVKTDVHIENLSLHF